MEQTNTKVSDNIFAAINANNADALVADALVADALEEQQYLDLIKDILDNGTWEEGRNGRTKSIFGNSMRFSLANGKIPILTTKKTAWKTCLRELLWFIRGETDNKLLQQQGVHIWDGNTSREFLDSRGLHTTKTNLIGPGYGFQWRHFNSPYDNQSGKALIPSLGIDQLQQIIDELKDPAKRNSRRLVMTAWNPSQPI
jgi:thymidylate synthase